MEKLTGFDVAGLSFLLLDLLDRRIQLKFSVIFSWKVLLLSPILRASQLLSNIAETSEYVACPKPFRHDIFSSLLFLREWFLMKLVIQYKDNLILFISIIFDSFVPKIKIGFD